MSQKFSEYLSRKKKEEPVASKQATKNKSNGSTVNKSSYSWEDLDIIIRKYDSSGELPPMLSPTIPSKYEPFNPDESIMPQLLSPTLPSKYEELPKPPTRNTKSTESNKQLYFEKVEHFGVHSYKYVKSTKNELLLKLYVPNYYKKNKHFPKENNTKHTKEKSLADSATKKKRKRSPVSDDDIHDKPLAKVKPLSQQDLLQRRKDELLNIAREKKHAGDGLRNSDAKLAIVYSIDCIIVYLVAFSYEDQGRRLAKKLYNDNPWMSLIAFIDSVLELCTEHEFNDIAGLCLQIRTVVYEHVCKIIGEFVQLDQARKRKKSYDKQEDIEFIKAIDERINLNVKNLLRYRELSKRGLIQGEGYLSIFKLQEEYPAIISFFYKQKSNSDSQENHVDPARDAIQLPITHGVNIKEITAYSFHLIKQWCIKKGVDYSEWNFQ